MALVAPCAVSCPPRGYGGTELIVAELANALTSLGHDVTVFATGDSRCDGTIRHVFEHAVWPPNDLAEAKHASFAWQEIRPDAFDVVHVHHPMSLAMRDPDMPTVMTIHVDRDDRLLALYLHHRDVHYVSISRRQDALLDPLPTTTIHHGLDIDRYPFGDGTGGYVAFLGRLAPQKGPEIAIEAARIANVPLHIGGGISPLEPDHFALHVEPAIRSGVKWFGELGHAGKVALLRRARALLFPIQWEEPFGLVMIESMLIGTPVIAFGRGSVPEIVEDGCTGFIVRNAREMAACIARLDSFDRKRCRARARERWCAKRMAKEYIRVYERAIESYSNSAAE